METSGLHHFLSGMAKAGSSILGAPKATALPFVTISRQAGAGGHRLAEALVAIMEREENHALFQGWQVCDQQLCEKLAQDPHLQVSMDSLLAEEYRAQIHTFLSSLLGTQSDQNQVARKLFENIRALARVGKVIIVGRAGSQVTRELPLGVHVRLVAPENQRLKRMAGLLGKPEAEAHRIMNQQDTDRTRLLKSFFHADIDDPLLYDCVWNTGLAPFEAIAAAIITLVKQRISAYSDAPS
ncbi:MAG: cytidylate kinase-like family protein [Gammaproteobacteria bacterium]|nr:cytidylate kinase-like family protein [Gammaproteobacteria bacterium]MCP5424889.1 cytidylate kinase-like family protein [Gammaproteobacteria bacterium]MCP5458135.1 cytidylate kinase-like family protein [Gammaproteobacteria bacterium]